MVSSFVQNPALCPGLLLVVLYLVVTLAAERPENENLGAELAPRMMPFGRAPAPASSAKRVAVDQEHQRRDVNVMSERFGDTSFPHRLPATQTFVALLETS
jgi:hypothetical protein